MTNHKHKKGLLMSFYIFDFGPVSSKLQEYADSNGKIPEAGDDWEDFDWPHNLARSFADKDNGPQLWQEFIAEAHSKINRAIQVLEELKEESPTQ
ncbi:hypothetical protein [[Phormidium] sp. ETS-05]|uniref:hypothetical protein n=1 Tax=[Phormidium] sp. ETS-05 TaxID=222819 RepID=UPI0018EEEF02|nr:hypothetical protein [[Phormidium] sp. ETS-05]